MKILYPFVLTLKKQILNGEFINPVSAQADRMNLVTVLAGFCLC